MAWSGTFRAWLEQGALFPRFVVEFVRPDGLSFVNFPSSGGRTYGSHTIDGPDEWIGAGLPQINGETLDPLRWLVQGGGCTIPLAATWERLPELRSYLYKGAIVRVRAGAAGWATSALEPIWSGVLTNVTGTYGEHGEQVIQLSCDSLQQALIQPQHGGQAEDLILYKDLRSDTSRTHGIVDGSGWSVGPNDITFSGTVGDWDQYDYASGAKIAVLCDPTGSLGSISGSAFVLLFDSWDGGTSTLQTPVDADQFGTTRATLSSGDYCYLCPYVGTNAVDAWLRIVTSTGSSQDSTTLNGADDTLPFEWGVGLPASVVDSGDARQQRNAVLDGGAAAITFDVLTTQGVIDNPRAMLQGYLAPMGLVMVQFQGALTLRAAQDPTGTVVAPTYLSITDQDVMAITWEMWGAAFLEGGTTTWTDADEATQDTSSRVVTSFPVRGDETVTVPYLYTSTGSAASGTSVLSSIVSRLEVWREQPPEVYSIRCRGLRLSGLAVGDLPLLNLSRFEYAGKSGGAVRCLVLHVQPDWRANMTFLRVAVLREAVAQ